MVCPLKFVQDAEIIPQTSLYFICGVPFQSFWSCLLLISEGFLMPHADKHEQCKGFGLQPV